MFIPQSIIFHSLWNVAPHLGDLSCREMTMREFFPWGQCYPEYMVYDYFNHYQNLNKRNYMCCSKPETQSTLFFVSLIILISPRT